MTEAKMEIGVHLRCMIQHDMPEVPHIEQSSFESPWQEEDFVRCLRQNCIGRSAEWEDQVVGFYIYGLSTAGVELLNFAVCPSLRRNGVGRQMMEEAQKKLERTRPRLFCQVREGNLDAQLFFRAMGFRCVSILQDCYEDTDEDAYVMNYHHKPELVSKDD